LTISEYFGNVATKDAGLSACHVKISGACEEAWQTPDFDEYVLIESGEVHLQHAGGTTIVKGGSGVFLPAGFRVKWIFPAACTYIPICTPAFSPDNINREEGDVEPKESKGEMSIIDPVNVVKVDTLTITEYFGNVANQDSKLSACYATVSAPCAEAYQAPDFDEYVLVLKGEIHLEQAEGTTVVGEGKGVLLKAGERVKWTWPGPSCYIPICLPAFTPDNCHREAEEGAAKDKAAMDKLHALHKDSADQPKPDQDC
jgi:uncharacterized cupin superfamily protein